MSFHGYRQIDVTREPYKVNIDVKQALRPGVKPERGGGDAAFAMKLRQGLAILPFWIS